MKLGHIADKEHKEPTKLGQISTEQGSAHIMKEAHWSSSNDL